MKSRIQINKEVQHDAKLDIVSQFTGILSALLPVLGILGINLDWFNESFIDGVAVLISAIIIFVVNLLAIWRNHFSGKKAKKQNEALKEKGLK